MRQVLADPTLSLREPLATAKTCQVRASANVLTINIFICLLRYCAAFRVTVSEVFAQGSFINDENHSVISEL